MKYKTKRNIIVSTLSIGCFVICFIVFINYAGKKLQEEEIIRQQVNAQIIKNSKYKYSANTRAGDLYFYLSDGVNEVRVNLKTYINSTAIEIK